MSTILDGKVYFSPAEVAEHVSDKCAPLLAEIEQLTAASKVLFQFQEEMHKQKEHAEAAEREISALRRVWEDAKKLHAQEMGELCAQLEAIRSLVNVQAEDHGLWFEAEHAPEAYLQQELRKLHSIIERSIDAAGAEKPE